MADKNFGRTIRFAAPGGIFGDFTPEEVIIKDMNRFRGWSCSAGLNGLFIDWMGDVYPATCQVGVTKPYGNINSGFELPTSHLLCNKEHCVCNIEISLPKYRPGFEMREGEMFATEDRALDLAQADHVTAALKHDREIKYVMWALGRRCNYFCSYCDDNSHSRTDPFVSREAMYGTFEQIEKQWGGRMRFAFSGGEPTLNPHFLEFAKHIEAKGHFVGTTTNGSRNAEYYIDLHRASTLNFSVHFEFVREDRFVGLMESLVAAKMSGEAPRECWADIRFMLRPGDVERAERLSSRLAAIPHFSELIFSSFVPVRKPNTNSLYDYSRQEMQQMENLMRRSP